MLELKNICVNVEEKVIIENFTFPFPEHTTTAILGHNGSGKSSLALAIAGHPRYSTTGSIVLDGDELTSLSPSERHVRGIFLSFQNIPEIPGIKVSEYLRTIYNESFTRTHRDEKVPSPFVFKRMVEKLLPGLGLTPKFLDRDLFVGFSGGEKRRIELLQITLLDPSVIILDEVDSGLDIDAIGILKTHIDTWRANGKTIVIISHNFHLIDSIDVDRIVIMKDGQIDRHGERDLVEQIKKSGFQGE